mgnify:CR=1 FL=1
MDEEKWKRKLDEEIMTQRILFVEDDESLREVISLNLEDLGYVVDQASSGFEALTLFKTALNNEQSYVTVISDIKMPEMNGLDLLVKLKQLEATVPVIILTAFGGIEQTLEAMRKGAFHYVEKPVNLKALSVEINRAINHYQSLVDQTKTTVVDNDKKEYKSSSSHRLIASSPAMNKVLKVVDKVANSDAPIMILGESGVGKELIAQALHQRSNRAQGPWVTVNCAAIPSELLESVLFGYEKGAFTGAQKRQDGKFTLADKGTLFLDEIAEMSPALQSKLLRVLQDGLVERVGAIQPEQVDVRIVTATHQNLIKAMDQGSFRRDLYYRLHVVPIHVPPLRERSNDIPVLFRHFVREFVPQTQLQITSEVDQACLNYSWPGNIRELRNLVERLILLRDHDRLELSDLPLELQNELKDKGHTSSLIHEQRSEQVPCLLEETDDSTVKVRVGSLSFSLPKSGLDLKALEKEILLQALALNQGNQSATARYLSIPRHALLYRLEKFQEDKSQEDESS